MGREEETAALTEVVAASLDAGEMALLSIEGGGGMGKTTLALRWTHDNVTRFPGGQLFADLRGFDPTGTPASSLSVLHGFLSALGVEPAAIPTDLGAAAALYRSVLAGRHVIVVLDNALDTVQVLPLLPGTAPCTAIVTSRNHLAGLRVQGARSLRLDTLAPGTGRALLVHHLGARAVDTEPEAADVLVDCCAGLPLALSLVAARMSLHPNFPLSVLAEELRKTSTRLDAFDSGDETVSVRNVLAWSTSSLDADQARAFRLFGAAPIPELGRAAAASLFGLPTATTDVLLRALELKSLVRQQRPGRFRMHDLIRLHAVELGAASDRAEIRLAAARRLVDHYLHTALGADRLLYAHRTRIDPPEPAEGCAPLPLEDESSALTWFDQEHDQLLVVQREAAKLGWTEHVWQLSRAIDTYHYRRSHLRDNVTASRAGAEAADLMGIAEVRTLAYRQLGRACTRANEFTEALTCLEKALVLAEESTDPTSQAHTHHDLARLHSMCHRHAPALRHATIALEFYRSTGNPVGEAHALNSMARQHAELGEHDLARECCEAALKLHERHRNASGAAAVLDNLGFIAQRAGDQPEASRHYDRALTACRELGNAFFEAEVAEHLGDALQAQGVPEATDVLRLAHELYADQHRTADADRVLGRITG